jgi:short-subunit dehydrogenase
MKIQGKTIVVTGGGNGIGRELVLALLARGAKVAAVDINDEALQETVKLAGNNASKISTHIVNITDKEAVETLPAQIIEKHGSVDGVINNAGIIQPFVKVNELDYETINRVFKVNFDGTLFMVKSFLPHLLKRPEAHILNVASMGGFLPVPGQSIYGAAKSAVKLFTEAMYAELRNTNVYVTVVFPGAIATNITANSGIEIPKRAGADQKKSKGMKTLPASKAADLILNAMEKNKYRALIGPDAKFMDFIYRISPKFANGFIAKRMGKLLD